MKSRCIILIQLLLLGCTFIDDKPFSFSNNEIDSIHQFLEKESNLSGNGYIFISYDNDCFSNFDNNLLRKEQKEILERMNKLEFEVFLKNEELTLWASLGLEGCWGYVVMNEINSEPPKIINALDSSFSVKINRYESTGEYLGNFSGEVFGNPRLQRNKGVQTQKPTD